MSFSRTFQGGGGKNPKVLEHAPSISVIVPESPEAPVARRIISTTNRKQVHIKYISVKFKRTINIPCYGPQNRVLIINILYKDHIASV